MTALSVNLNKVALLRNSRGRNYPDLVKVALDCQQMGADGITIHPRPDERHARKSDIPALKEAISVELNVEGYPNEDLLQVVEKYKPAQFTMVPDPPGALTSDSGWDTITHASFLKEIIARMHEAGIRCSIFIGTEPKFIEAAVATGTDRLELYTEPYAAHYSMDSREKVVAPFTQAAQLAHELGLKINAGHDLNLDNLAYFAEKVPHLDEVSIGHALITDALYIGLQETITRYQKCLGK
ncbi:MAG: pyridoxine 5'-phosphate synthase [Bacteroidota bacterium]